MATQCSAVPAGGMQKSNPTVNRQSWISVIKSWNPFTSSLEDKFFHIKWFKTITDPHFLRWISLFSYKSLKNLNPQEKEQQEHQFKFTLFALDKMKEVIYDLNLEEKCGINCNGAIRFHYPNTPTENTKNASFSVEPISRIFPNGKNGDDLFEIEKSSPKWPKTIESAELETSSCAGNCEEFTKCLAEVAKKKLGVQFLMNAEVRSIEMETLKTPSSLLGNEKNKSLKTIYTTKGKIDIDENTEVVLATGSWTPSLLWKCGYFAPIYPMKGYSVSMNLPKVGSSNRPLESDLPSRMLIDKKMYISRLGDQIRVTSIGEFCGWNTTPDPKINETFRYNGRIRVPAVQSLFDLTPTRCGLRPYSADGIILLGRIEKITNLSVNVGPGFNGWKISIGAADVLGNILSNKHNESYSFEKEKLSPEGRIVYSPLWCLLSRIRWE